MLAFLETGGILFSLVVGFLILYLYLTSIESYWKDRGVPYIKPHFIFGNIGPMIFGTKAPAKLFTEFYNAKEFEGASFGGLWGMRQPIVFVRDPDILKDIFIKDFEYFSERGILANDQINPLSNNLFSISGWRWKVLRSHLSPTFSSGKIKHMFETIAECSSGLEEELKIPARNGDIVDMIEPLERFTTQVIGSNIYGLQLSDEMNLEFRKMSENALNSNLKSLFIRILGLAFPNILKKLHYSFVDFKVIKFFISIVDEVIKYREQHNIKRKDTMELLMEMKKRGSIANELGKFSITEGLPIDERGRKIMEVTNELIAAQCFIFFLAGFGTSASTMGFTFYELARNPEIQEKLVKEIEEVLAKHNNLVTFDSIMEMKYLDMVVSEVLRYYAPAQNITRKVSKDYKINGSNVVIEKGTYVFIPVYALHYDPKYFPDPEKFIPERFSDEEKGKRHPMVYLPFGKGPRNCIGGRYGLVQTKLGIVTVLRKYKVEICHKTKVPPVLEAATLVTTMKGGIHLRIANR